MNNDSVQTKKYQQNKKTKAPPYIIQTGTTYKDSTRAFDWKGALFEYNVGDFWQVTGSEILEMELQQWS